MDTNEKIRVDPERYYAASTIITGKMFPWVRSKVTFTKMLAEPTGQALYKPIVRTVGNQTRYSIKGSTILEILRLADEGKLSI